MNAIAETRKPQIRNQARPATPEDRLSELRSQAQSLRAELDRLTSEHRRCMEKAASLEGKVNHVEQMRRALEGLYSLKSSGGRVDAVDIRKAEAALRAAQADADRAAPAAAGAKQAADSFLQQTKPVQSQLAVVRAAAIQTLATVFQQLIRDSIREHAKAVEKFVRAHAEQHGRVNAVCALAKELRLGDGTCFANSFPNGGAARLEIPVISTSLPADANNLVKMTPHTLAFPDLHKEIERVAAETRNELRELLP